MYNVAPMWVSDFIYFCFLYYVGEIGFCKIASYCWTSPGLYARCTMMQMHQWCIDYCQKWSSVYTINPIPHLQFWEDFDAIIRSALSRLPGVSLSQQQLAQATMPVVVGELRAHHCYAAYITSLLASQELKQDIQGKSAEECPPVVTAEVLDKL